MSIIVLTPKPNNAAAVPNTDESLSVRLASDFLHMLGQDGRRFETFEQLRDYAQAQIDAAATLAHINAPVAVEPIKPAADEAGYAGGVNAAPAGIEAAGADGAGPV